MLPALSDGWPRVQSGPLALAALLAVILVAGEWLMFAGLLVAVGGPWAPLQVLGAFSLATIGAKLPLTAMGLGTREGLVLALFEGVPGEQLVAATLLHSTLAHLLPTLLGTVAAWSFFRDVITPPGPADGDADPP